MVNIVIPLIFVRQLQHKPLLLRFNYGTSKDTSCNNFCS